ncbi:hypothetical protein ACH5RR_004399 [Cinchona calisaya]|uniref:Transposase n=1 Tax=Cinchona calisaya TaxID=153742 RepID=A0ABD3AY24_9GENT
MNRDHAQLDAEFVARHIKDLVKSQISISSASIQAEISEKFNYDISLKKAWMAKQKAIVELFGAWVKKTGRGRPKSTSYFAIQRQCEISESFPWCNIS